MRIPHFLLTGMCLALCAAANAASISISNPGFETPVTAPATFTGNTNAAPAGWAVYNTGDTNGFRYFGVWNPSTTNSFTEGAPGGANVGVVFLLNDFNIAEAGLRQTLGDTLQLSTQYTLTVEVGNFAPEDSPTPTFDFEGFPGYRVELLAGGVVIATDDNTLAPGEGEFLTSTVTLTTGLSHANAGQALGIRLVNLNGEGIEVNFDDVRLDATAVPEPSSAMLLGLGALAVLRLRRVR